MTAEPIEIRRMQPDEASPFREIRLEALLSNPEAFQPALTLKAPDR